MDLEKNKIQSELSKAHTRIWRGIVTDHFSGTIYLRYYQMAGESAYDTIRFLMDAWMPSKRQDLIFHGLPEILFTDQGPGNTNVFMKNLCQNYGIDLRFHTPGKPWSKGQVECAHNIVETHFESMIVANPPYNLEELNQRADDWQVEYNANKVLIRNRMAVDTRYNLWQQFLNVGHLRVPGSEEEFKSCASRDVMIKTVSNQRTVRAPVVSGEIMKTFMLPTQLRHLAGKKIRIVINPFYWHDKKSILVSEDGKEWFLAHEVGVRAGGFLATAEPIHHPRAQQTNVSEDFRRRAEARTMAPAAVVPMDEKQRQAIAARYDELPQRRTVQPKTAIEITFTPDQARDAIRSALPGMSLELKSQLWHDTQKPMTQIQIDALIAVYRTRMTDDFTERGLCAG